MVQGRQVSPWRKAAFYGGYLSVVLGLLLFISCVVTFIGLFRGPLGEGQILGPTKLGSMAARAVGGVALIVLGGFLRTLGLRGLAGSLVVLDPPGARRDLEPWARAAGGLLDDALSESKTVQDLAAREGGASGPEIKVRCPSCRALNDEDARYCKACGAEVGEP